MNRLRSSFALGALSLLAASCQGNDPCAESGTACGGDLTGNWTAVSGCRDPYYKGPDRLTFQFQPETAAREPLPEGTSSDWCSYLVYQGDKITGFQFPYDTPRLGGVAMTFGADGTYTARITLQVGGQVDIPETCLTRFGVRPTCGPADPTLPSPPRSVTDDLQASVATAGSYQGISCSDAADGGCHCEYSADFDPTVGGNFTADGSIVTLFDSNKQLPAQVDFCAAGDTLTLWGHNRASIWNQVPGVRTVQLVRAAAASP
jgi:hypothetical protein